jgi:hypothetical protein
VDVKVDTNVSEKHIASIFRAEKLIDELSECQLRKEDSIP